MMSPSARRSFDAHTYGRRRQLAYALHAPDHPSVVAIVTERRPSNHASHQALVRVRCSADARARRRAGRARVGAHPTRPPAGPRDPVAGGVRLPADLRGRVDLHRPLRLAGAAARVAPASPGAARCDLDRALRQRSRSGRGHPGRPHALRPRRRRSRPGASPPDQGLWVGVAGASHAAAWRRRAGRRGRCSPALRARALRRPLRPESALEAACSDARCRWTAS